VRVFRPRQAVVFATLGSGVFSGCVYYNTLYNAEDLYGEAEDLRLAGQTSAVEELYREVVDKATGGYRGDEEGGYADDALFLIGKARFRLGELAEASRAFDQVFDVSEDPDLRAQAALYRGVIAVADGETARGIAILDVVMEGVEEPIHLAEGHLWRARAFFQLGMMEQGWSDLDQVADVSSAHLVTANLERIAWGFTLMDLTRIHQGIQELIFTDRAEVYGDSIRSLARRFADRWGPLSAGVLLDNAEGAHWSKDERDRLLMTRAGFAHEAGETRRAERDARLVGSGVGEQAAAARVTLAKWRLVEVEEVRQLERFRSVLLPAVSYEEAQVLLNAMRRVELLTEYGLEGEPVALIGAAEISRDVLVAGRLSAALFHSYAVAAPDGAWIGKALLASRALTPDSAERERLAGLLDALPADPYVRYAHKAHGGVDLGELESRLQEVLDPLLVRVDEELMARRQLAGVPNK
jgi:tetratricopeptide (TPR) repeat protein